MNVFHAFSGVDSQLMAEKRVFDNVNVLGTMEVDVDAIISSALVHENEKFLRYYNEQWTNEQYKMATK